MFRRSLSDNLIDALTNSPFWMGVIADRQLSPEIRDGHVTVYYRGGALIQRLRLEGEKLVADVHPKYIPVRASKPSVRLTWSESGFAFNGDVEALPLGLATSGVLASYKEQMAKTLVDFPEAAIVQQIIERTENTILDQEIAFQESGSSRDKIDLCHFDQTLGKLVFVEVKRREDPRLFKPDGAPEVLEQLAAYAQRLEANRTAIMDSYRIVVASKRRLGMGDRLKSVPTTGLIELLTKPVLVIGGCSREDVKAIKERKDEWEPLMTRLPTLASGLILCGESGCRLALSAATQTLVFSSSP